jgi:citrate synthase
MRETQQLEMVLHTSIATSDEESITVRDKDLTDDLVGEYDFGEFFIFHLTGEEPTESERRLFNAMLVTIAEHDITPSVIASRLMYDSAPEAVQGAVAAGLLGTGETFVGSMQNVTEMIEKGVDRVAEGESMDAVAESIVDERDRLPGFGHPEHYPTDPRTDRLFELLEEEDMAGDHLALIECIQDVAEETYDTHLLINATGAIGVVLAEMDLNADAMAARGIAIVARAAGLIGHLNEEIEQPMARDIWDLVLDHTEYQDPDSH